MYTQNIDSLEAAAGIERVVQCHGSFATVSCLRCATTLDGDAVKEDVLAKVRSAYARRHALSGLPL